LLFCVCILFITALAIWLSIFRTQDDYAPDGINYLQGVKDQGTGIRGQGSEKHAGEVGRLPGTQKRARDRAIA
jgi:hypothetical protein